MEYHNSSCNFLLPDVIEASVPLDSLYNRINKRRFFFLIAPITSRLRALLHIKNISRGTRDSTIILPHQENVPSPENENLRLQPGDWVEVRSIDEIAKTLDGRKKFKGLYFMPEMEKYCGKKFKIFKKVEKIKLESTGESRKLKSPTVFLEGVYCNGDHHEGCDRSCFHFWREVWLKKK